MVKGLHMVRGTLAHDVVEGAVFVLPLDDGLPGADVVVKDVKDGHPASVLPRHKPLAHDPAHGVSQPHPYLSFLLDGEKAHDSVDGVSRPHRVHGGEDQVAGLGGREGHLHGVPVPDLPDKDHVGGLTQGRSQPVSEGVKVPAELPLVEGSLDRLVHVFHRVLKGYDVEGLVVVYLLKDGGKSGGLPLARGPGHQDDT